MQEFTALYNTLQKGVPNPSGQNETLSYNVRIEHQQATEQIIKFEKGNSDKEIQVVFPLSEYISFISSLSNEVNALVKTISANAGNLAESYVFVVLSQTALENIKSDEYGK
ncbi:hypothetical protein [Escherichia coli]|uniref:hypothetical protein n=1 Tax=Escherichia coli TaxID=562 RepID=UPI003B9A3B49